MAVAMHHVISFYPKAWDVKSQESIPLDLFLENIKDGKWEDLVNKVRIIKDKKERDELKKKIAPSVTIAGKFTERTDAALEHHSGFIAIDVDDIDDINAVKSILCADPYVAACFQTIGGRGLCILFRINPDKHREAFQGICEYLFTTYSIICDPTSVNVSRARFVSFDPHIYIADKFEKFTKYPKEKPPKKIERFIYARNDFEQILQQITQRSINITQDSYQVWLRIAFALAHKFGEEGRQYFHIVSQYSAKYEYKVCDKQYDAVVKRKGAAGGKEIVTISTFYHYCKAASVDIYTERTKKIAYSASYGKKEGLAPDTVEQNLANIEDIKGDDVKSIIKQVFENGIEISEDGMLEQLEYWVNQNYNLKRNEITRYIEDNGKPLTQADLNSIYIRAKKIFEKLTYDIIDRLIHSNFVPSYNPFHLFFAEYALKREKQAIPDVINGTGVNSPEALKARESVPHLITDLFNSIETTDPEYLHHFGPKWLVGFIASIYGEHSPLMFVLSGEKQNTGKTEWFRRLFPKAWREPQDYYAESKLDAGKDDEILMTQKLLIMDDEMGGKSKREIKKLKELTSKQIFSLREPYGRNNVDLRRLAVLGGTTNDNEILSDPTGNRRIVPIHVESINFDLYNHIDKDELWFQIYDLYKSGYQWRLNRDDIKYLGKYGAEFELSMAETELVARYFEPGEDEWLTATDIKVYIESKTNQHLNLSRIGQDLKRLGCCQRHIRTGASTKRVYGIKYLDQTSVYSTRKSAVNVYSDSPKHNPDDLPF